MPDGSTGCRSSRLDSGRPINRRAIRSTGGGIVMGLGMSHVQRRIGSKRSRACPSRPRLATARAPPAGCPHKHPDHLHVVVEAEAYRTIRHVLRRLVLARLESWKRLACEAISRQLTRRIGTCHETPQPGRERPPEQASGDVAGTTPGVAHVLAAVLEPKSRAAQDAARCPSESCRADALKINNARQ